MSNGRLIEAVAYFGIAKSTINDEEPMWTVSPNPFSGAAFEQYIWYRATVKLPIQPDILRAQLGQIEEVKEQGDADR